MNVYSPPPSSYFTIGFVRLFVCTVIKISKKNISPVSVFMKFSTDVHTP